MGIKRESKKHTESAGGETLRLNKALEKRGGRLRGLCLLNPPHTPEKWTSEVGERELEQWWAGLRERGKQPRLTGIEQSCTLNLSECRHSRYVCLSLILWESLKYSGGVNNPQWIFTRVPLGFFHFCIIKPNLGCGAMLLLRISTLRIKQIISCKVTDHHCVQPAWYPKRQRHTVRTEHGEHSGAFGSENTWYFPKGGQHHKLQLNAIQCALDVWGGNWLLTGNNFMGW